jgi:hypothetical protein
MLGDILPALDGLAETFGLGCRVESDIWVTVHPVVPEGSDNCYLEVDSGRGDVIPLPQELVILHIHPEEIFQVLFVLESPEEVIQRNSIAGSCGFGCCQRNEALKFYPVLVDFSHRILP